MASIKDTDDQQNDRAFDKQFTSGLTSYEPIATGDVYVPSSGSSLGVVPIRRQGYQGVIIGCYDGTTECVFFPAVLVEGVEDEIYNLEYTINVMCMDFQKLSEGSSTKYCELNVQVRVNSIAFNAVTTYLIHPGDGIVTIKHRYGDELPSDGDNSVHLLIGNNSNSGGAGVTTGPYPVLTGWDVQLL